jgi:hypothetical protein
MKFIKNKHINKHDKPPPMSYVDLWTLYGWYTVIHELESDEESDDEN